MTVNPSELAGSNLESAAAMMRSFHIDDSCSEQHIARGTSEQHGIEAKQLSEFVFATVNAVDGD